MEPIRVPVHAIALLYPHLQAAAHREPSWMLRTIQCNALWILFHTVGGTQVLWKTYLILISVMITVLNLRS